MIRGFDPSIAETPGCRPPSGWDAEARRSEQSHVQIGDFPHSLGPELPFGSPRELLGTSHLRAS